MNRLIKVFVLLSAFSSGALFHRYYFSNLVSQNSSNHVYLRNISGSDMKVLKEDPDVIVVYHKIQKTGSTTFDYILSRFSESRNFTFKNYPSGGKSLNNAQQV